MAGENKKVLIVSFLYPPMNDIGAFRMVKFVKYLPQFGWTPIVLTSDNVKSNTLMSTGINESNIIRVRHFTLGALIQRKLSDTHSALTTQVTPGRLTWKRSLKGILGPLRHIYTLPVVRILEDDPVGWYNPAVKKGLEIIKEFKPDVIFSSFSPAMSHIVAARLHSRTQVPWVAEFRDPWSLNQYKSKTQPFQFFEEKLEKNVIKGSSMLVAVSDALAQRMVAFHSKEVAVIPNGFDVDDYKETVDLSHKFVITHTGNIYSGRDPKALFAAIKILKDEGKVSSNNFEVRFFGKYISPVVSMIKEYKLDQLVKVFGLIPFEESVRKQKESTVLLLLTWNDPREWTYPGKIFEYFGAGRPILATALEGGEIDRLLDETGCGLVANKPEEIKFILEKWLLEFNQSGHLESWFKPNLNMINTFCRKIQTGKLAEVIDKVSEKQNRNK